MSMNKQKFTALLTTAAIAVGFVATSPLTGQSAYAQQSEKGLKDIYANYFRIGTCFPSAHTAATETALRNVILREFNSITHENGLKPQNTMQQSTSTDNDIKVSFNNEAKNVLAFCTANNIPIRGHTFVWHSQTPEWLFYANMQSGNKNALASKEVMYKRMESYIKNMFAALKAQYPTLNLYAYDVANEIFDNNGKPRPGGFYSDGNNGDNSPWVKVFGNNSFVDSAFVYARRYAPPNCKLFYNDFNEYMGKTDSMVALYKRLKAKNVIDGLGMQSHLSTSYPSAAQYTTALNKFVQAGAEIHVTELDITIESGANEATQATRYKEIFQALKTAKDNGGKVTSVSVWGVRDDWSWRASNNRNPLLFTSSYAKKQAYNQVAALIPEKDHGNGNNPDGGGGVVEPVVPVQPDKNGYFFHHTYEDGTVQGWTGRGDATVANTNTQKANGSRSLAVTGRTKAWHGASYSLNANAFIPGSDYSFSAIAMYNTGADVNTFQLTLQYTLDSTRYGQVAQVEAVKGRWTMLENANFAIPAGATNLLLYVEMPSDSTASFYIDDVMGGIAGAKAPGKGSTALVLNGKNAVRGNTSLVTITGRTLNINAGTGVDSKTRIRVVNMTGKTVASFNAIGNAKLSLRKIPSGAYIVEARRMTDGYRMTSAIMLR